MDEAEDRLYVVGEVDDILHDMLLGEVEDRLQVGGDVEGRLKVVGVRVVENRLQGARVVVEGMLQVLGKDKDILLEIIEDMLQAVGVVEDRRLLSDDEVVYEGEDRFLTMVEMDMEDVMGLEMEVVGMEDSLEMLEIAKGLSEVFEGSLWIYISEGGRWIGT